MAVDDSICPSHEKNRVALYCQTCEVLICTKCVSHSPYSAGRHRDHVYLDISEAYEMWQEELGKLVSGIRSDLQERKNEKQNLHSTLQKLQLALLRKKTQLGKCTKSLRDQLSKKEKQFVSSVEQIIVPAINTAQEHYKSVEYDTVSNEGLLGSAEAVQLLNRTRSITFLKSISNVKKEYDEMRSRTFTEPADNTQTVQTLIDVSLNLHRERYMLDRAFSLADTVPEIPQLLYNWCVIGHKSASIVWKFKKTDTVKKFHVYYKKFSHSDLNFINNIVKSVANEELDKFIMQDIKNRNSASEKDKLSTESNASSSDNISDIKESGSAKSNDHCSEMNQSKNEHNDENVIAEHPKKWYDINWLFWRKSKTLTDTKILSNEDKLSIDSDTKVKELDPAETTDSKSDTAETNAVKGKTDNNDNANNKKVCLSAPTQVSDNDTDGSTGSKSSSSDKPRRIRKLSYTISPEQSSFIEPCDFLNESIKTKNEANKSITNGGSYYSMYGSRTNSNKNNTPTPIGVIRQSRANFPSPTPQRKNSAPHSRPPSTRLQNRELTEKRSSRAHSLEAVRKPNSPATTQPRSTTPMRYAGTVSSGYGQRSLWQSSTSRDVKLERSTSLKSRDVRLESSSSLKSPPGRISRRDQVKFGSKNSQNVLESQQSSEFDDENMKDIYNEKSHLKKISFEKEKRNGGTGILGTYSLYTESKSENGSKPDVKMNQKNSTKLIRTESDSDNVFSDIDNTKPKNSEKAGDSKSCTPSKNTTKLSKNKKESKTKNKQLHVEKKWSKSKHQEFVRISDIDTKTMEEFNHFKISKFVPGRVHALLHDLEEDTNYFAFVSASNHCGESTAAVVHFKTGAMHDGKTSTCGHMIAGAHAHSQSWKHIYSNVFSKFLLCLSLAIFMFIVFYCFTENIQSKFCQSISRNKDLSIVCPDIVVTKLCSGYTESISANNHCEKQELYDIASQGKQTTLIELLLDFFNLSI